MRSRYFGLAVLAAATLAADVCYAADPQPYQVTIAGTGNGEVDDAIRATSLLASLRSSVPAPPFALIDRARGDAGRFETVLQGFGYYKASVNVTIAGRDVSDSELPDQLDHIPQGTSVDVHVSIDHGPQYRLHKVEIEGVVPPDARDALGIAPGQPAIAVNVLAAQAHLLAALQEDGYAFAKVDTPIATADDAADVLDITFKADTGPRTTIGPITFHGLKHVHETIVRKVLTIHTGDRYKPSAIDAARQAVMALGVFSGITVRAADHPEQNGSVPLTFDVQERARHAVAISANFSTDLGASLSASWSHRNLLGNAEQLNLSAAGNGLGGSATTGLGYNLTAQFIKPYFLAKGQDLEVDLAGIKQNFDAYDQTAQSIGVFLKRKLSKLWSASAGLSATHDDITQEGSTRLYELLAMPVSATYDSTGLTDPLTDPTHGIRASLSITPTVAFGARSLTFAILQASTSYYLDIAGDGRSILALRGLAGSIQGGSNFDLPPDQRFYAGGSSTVRGFRYQSIGPHFADGKPTGAASVDAATVEFRQRLWNDWGAVAFVDAGQAGTNSVPFNGSMNVGAGVGVRYYTSIGAVRADIAVPLTHVPQNDAFEIYISLGQAF